MSRNHAKVIFCASLLRFTIALGIGACILFFNRCAMLGGGSEIQRSKNYAVSSPAGWTARDNNGESDQAYKLASGSLVTVTSSCNQNTHSTLELMTKHLLMGARNIHYEKKTKVTVAGQEGLHSILTANYESHPFHLEVFVLPKNSCIFDFTLMNPKQIPVDDSNQFMNFIKTFSYGTN